MKLIYIFIFVVLLLLGFSACSNTISKTNKKAKITKVSEHKKIGLASWYGRPFHGRKTATGERYDMYKLTAAHKTLPFGTKVRVINTRNNKSVIVVINDRGPYVWGRIIDLSYAAFKQIENPKKGVIKVKLEILN